LFDTIPEPVAWDMPREAKDKKASDTDIISLADYRQVNDGPDIFAGRKSKDSGRGDFDYGRIIDFYYKNGFQQLGDTNLLYVYTEI
jgi:hypothetical protein